MARSLGPIDPARLHALNEEWRKHELANLAFAARCFHEAARREAEQRFRSHGHPRKAKSNRPRLDRSARRRPAIRSLVLHESGKSDLGIQNKLASATRNIGRKSTR